MFRILFVFVVALASGVAHAATCDAGYYLNENSECTICNSKNVGFHYCPGDDTQHECPPNNLDFADKLPTGWVIENPLGYDGDWSRSAATTVYDCHSNYFINTPTGALLKECGWNKTDYWCDSELWYFAADGYYLSRYHWHSSRDWYHAVKQCTNAPENATYTGPGTPDSVDSTIVDANDCPWACSDGFGRTATDTCMPLCTAGITTLNTSTGVRAPLFAAANTSPALHIRNNVGTCHADLILGTADKAIHIRYNGQTYHTTNINN